MYFYTIKDKKENVTDISIGIYFILKYKSMHFIKNINLNFLLASVLQTYQSP